MLKVKDLHASYGQKKILKGINFEAGKDEIIAVVGESGTGKTTLAMSIMGLLDNSVSGARTEGEIIFNGLNLCQLDTKGWKPIRWKQISMVFQNVDNILNPTMTIYQQLSEVADGSSENIEQMLDRVNFPLDRAHDYPHQLSMGEKQRVLVAMAYLPDPGVVILDEPTSALDQESKQDLIATIKSLSRSRAVILVTHDLDTAEKLSCKTLVLYGGSIVEYGSTGLIFSNPRHPYTRGLIRSYPSTGRTKDLQGRGAGRVCKTGLSFLAQVYPVYRHLQHKKT
ncbi:MAG: ABC transporter ATP-binding protein [Actinomycetota bacterium]|nr:ABC transporter ATP-binding protein [Actinomycetota bacterium]